MITVNKIQKLEMMENLELYFIGFVFHSFRSMSLRGAWQSFSFGDRRGESTKALLTWYWNIELCGVKWVFAMFILRRPVELPNLETVESNPSWCGFWRNCSFRALYGLFNLIGLKLKGISWLSKAGCDGEVVWVLFNYIN